MISKPANTPIDLDWSDRFDSDNDKKIAFNNRGPRPNAVGKQRRRGVPFWQNIRVMMARRGLCIMERC